MDLLIKSYRRTTTRDVIQHIMLVTGILLLIGTLRSQVTLEWQDITHVSGIISPERLPPSGTYRLQEAFSGHAVPFDYDQDGDLDLLLTYGPHAADSLYSGLNRLYRHDDTAWVDVTAETGLARFPPAGNAAVGDVNGDGYPDLYLGLFGMDLLLHNDSGRVWSDITTSSGLTNSSWSSGAVFLDANSDGYLDIYVANYLDYPRGDTLVCIDPTTRWRTYCSPLLYDPAPNRLFLNDSTGRFQEMTEAMGLADTSSRSLEVHLLDANRDGYLDLFVLSDRSPNLLYLRDEDSGFVEVGLFAGVALAPDGSEPDWRQVRTLDANQDGATDLLFTREDGRLLLMLNDGKGLFFEGHYQTGLFQPRFPYRATTVGVADVDFNGYTDILLADINYRPIREAVVNATNADSTAVSASRPEDRLQEWPKRILLSDDEHHFHPVRSDVPMVLDTVLLVPRVAAPALPDTVMYYLDERVPESLLLPLYPEVESLEQYAVDPLGSLEALEPTFGFDVSEDLSGLGTVRDTTDTVQDRFTGYQELDTVHVWQEAGEYVLADLTGDGIEDVIASYPAGVFRVWKRLSAEGPRFIGLWPKPGEPGTTIIGAEVIISSSPAMGLTRRYMVTDLNPKLFYFPRRPRSIDVVVKWPDGSGSRYRSTVTNRIYTLTRTVSEP